MLIDHHDDIETVAKDDEMSSDDDSDSDSLLSSRPQSSRSALPELSSSVSVVARNRDTYLRGSSSPSSPLSLQQQQQQLAEKNEGFASMYYTTTATTKTSTMDDDTVRNPPEIAQNCLLVPMAVAFWWYWTRRAAKRVWRRSCKSTRQLGIVAVLATSPDHVNNNHDSSSSTLNTSSNYNLDDSDRTVMSTPTTTSPPPGFSGKVVGPSDEDEFGTWEDVIESERGRDPSLRFVRWIKGGCAADTATRATSERGETQTSPTSLQRRLMKFASAPSLLIQDVSRRHGDNSVTGPSSGGGEQPPPIIETVTSSLEEVEVNAAAAGPTPTGGNTDYKPNDYYNYDYYFSSSSPPPPVPPRSPLRSFDWEYIHGVSESIEICSDHCSISPDDARILSSSDDISITTDEILSRTTVSAAAEASTGRSTTAVHDVHHDPDTSSSTACSCFMAAEQNEIT